MIKTLLNDGFIGIILTSEDKEKKSSFLNHISKHHKMLDEKLSIKTLSVKATKTSEVRQLFKNNQLQEAIIEASGKTVINILDQLEKAIDKGNVLYTLDELKNFLKSKKKPTKIIMTEKFNRQNQTLKRFQSTIQISKNLGTSVIVIHETNPIYSRIKQLGEFVCIISI